LDALATASQEARFEKLNPERMKTKSLAGETILSILTRAPGNNAVNGGLKVVADHDWSTARPSGTENVVKIHAESFKGESHLL
jgi:phosphoglucomutase